MSSDIASPSGVSAPPSRPKKRSADPDRGEACAECRRAKQKCDKQWPCSNCRKRGCAAICPDGEIQPSSEKEARKFNAKLLQRQTALEAQVEQLTRSLRDLTEGIQSSNSSIPSPGSTMRAHSLRNDSPAMPHHHPLGSPRLLSGHLDADQPDPREVGGVLRLEKDGESIFVGAGGSSWALQQAVAGEHAGLSSPSYHRNPAVPHRRPKPLMTDEASLLVSQILSSLPDLEEATNLVRAYFRYVSWLYNIVSEQQIGEDLALLWRPRHDGTPYPTAQRMSVVVMVLALGSLFSPNRPPLSPQPQYLYDASRQLLEHGRFLRHFTLAGVQTLHLAVSFLANTRESAAAQEGWVLLGTAGRLSQAQGFHIDGSKWSLTDDELEARRRVFWELQTYDRLQALSQGRPVFAPSVSFNTQKPLHVTPFDQQKYNLAPLLEAILVGVSSPTFRYSEALRLDRAIREVEGHAPTSLRGGMFARMTHHQDTESLDPLQSSHTIVQQHMHTLIVNKALLFLHRPWLGHILCQNIMEPLNSCFGVSFSASIAAAEALVENMSLALADCPHEARSFWFFIFHTFSAVVVLAACILRAPRSLHVLRTWEALQVAARIFAEWPQGHLDPFLSLALPIVTQLHTKAGTILQSTSSSRAEGNGIVIEQNDTRVRELLGFRSTAAGQSCPPSPPLSLSSGGQRGHLSIPLSLGAQTPMMFQPDQPLDWDPSVLSLQNLPSMDLDGLLEGNAFQGDFVTQGLDWIFDL